MDGGVLSLLFPVVHDQLLRFIDVEGEVIFLAPLSQGTHLLPVGSSLLVIRPNTVVSSVNLVIELETCETIQSWVNREYRKGLSTYPCWAPMLRISVVEVLLPTFSTWGRPARKSGGLIYQYCVKTITYERNLECSYA